MKPAAVLVLILCSTTIAAAEYPIDPLTGTLASEYGCQLDYEYYQPTQPKAVTTVILAHGFMRNLESMRGWALHWQTHDIATVIVSLCNSNLLNGHHQRNSDDLIALRANLLLENTIYAGFSAGGLAAYLAALRDFGASGYLGLDSVDSGALAKNDSRKLRVPALFLVAGPSVCNARNNMRETISKHAYQVSHIEGATHCHFESPYDKHCGWLCGRTSTQKTAEIQVDIMNQATQWILSTASNEGELQ
jgi:hypothetical protein